MFTSPKSIIYKVGDIKKAKEWYNELLGMKPLLDTPVSAMYILGEFALGLVQKTDVASKNSDSIVVYWEVSDVESAYNRLLRLGATADTEIGVVYNFKRATVKDPFGNILGIRALVTDIKNSVEEKPSQSAMSVTLMRALAAIDEREEIRGNDYMAEIFLPEDQRASLESSEIRRKIISSKPSIVYEYVIARTVYFDNIVEQALRENISQIVILGAGYDSRPYRFKNLIKDTRIFELDIHTTQKQKMDTLHQKNIPIPKQLSFVPVNFNTETLEDVLYKAGYNKDQKNLFIWEGVTYYLPSKAIDDTLNFIKSTSFAGSTVCFDYTTRWPDMMNAYGMRELIEVFMTKHSGEMARFSLERGKIGSFLSDRGFKIVDHLTAEDMERKFLTLRNGSLAGRVVGHFCLAYASVAV